MIKFTIPQEAKIEARSSRLQGLIDKELGRDKERAIRLIRSRPEFMEEADDIQSMLTRRIVVTKAASDSAIHKALDVMIPMNRIQNCLMISIEQSTDESQYFPDYALNTMTYQEVLRAKMLILEGISNSIEWQIDEDISEMCFESGLFSIRLKKPDDLLDMNSNDLQNNEVYQDIKFKKWAQDNMPRWIWEWISVNEYRPEYKTICLTHLPVYEKTREQEIAADRAGNKVMMEHLAASREHCIKTWIDQMSLFV